MIFFALSTSNWMLFKIKFLFPTEMLNKISSQVALIQIIIKFPAIKMLVTYLGMMESVENKKTGGSLWYKIRQ